MTENTKEEMSIGLKVKNMLWEKQKQDIINQISMLSAKSKGSFTLLYEGAIFPEVYEWLVENDFAVDTIKAKNTSEALTNPIVNIITVDEDCILPDVEDSDFERERQMGEDENETVTHYFKTPRKIVDRDMFID